MKVNTILKISILIVVIHFSSFIAKGQKIEDIDSSEVYILSIFNYCTDSLNSIDHPYNLTNITNSLKVMILEKDNELIPEFQTKLITGDNKYNYISKNDTFLLSYIDSIIQKYFIANVLFQVPLYRSPIDSLDLSNTDSLMLNRFLEFKELPLIKEFLINQYRTDASHYDIIDNRLIYDLLSIIYGISLKDGYPLFYYGRCPFRETGIYYMLLKVKMTYIVVNDENEKFLGSFNPYNLPSVNKNILICGTIPTKQIYHKKNSKNLLAIPLYVELLKPFNDINRIYMEK